MSIEHEVITLFNKHKFKPSEGLDQQEGNVRLTTFLHDRKCLWLVIENSSRTPTGLDGRNIAINGDHGRLDTTTLKNASLGNYVVVADFKNIRPNDYCEFELI